MMKIVTYNVNGLRSRVSQHGCLLKLLKSLDADIVCFQETKLSRRDLAADVTTTEGYEAFFSCTRTSDKGRTCYSGVATFCRVKSSYSSCEVALPMAAEEGITRLLEYHKQRKSLERDPFLEGLDNVPTSDLLKVDSEGRCIVTDHGHFVLFNLYGPRAQEDDKERLQFKSLFFLVLQKRWECLLSQGKRVVVVGDFNIAPTAMDRCDAKPDFEENRFRKWFRSLLVENGGPFLDCFRTMNPNRKEAYTCWAQDVGAEEFNYGSRIDHIIIAGKCFHQHNDMEKHSFLECHVENCEIMTEFRRGKLDTMPKWKGGRSVKLEGSDHAPVYILLRDVPDLPPHNTPPFAVRYTPEVRGLQQTIVSLLSKRQASLDTKLSESPTSSTCLDSLDSNFSENRHFSRQSIMSDNDLVASGSRLQSSQSIPTVSSEAFSQDDPLTFEGPRDNVHASLCTKGKLPAGCNVPAKKRKLKSSQRSILSFFYQSKTLSSPNEVCSSRITHNQIAITEAEYDYSQETQDISTTDTSFDRDEDIILGGRGDSRSAHDVVRQCDPKENLNLEEDTCSVALARWKEIQQKMHSSLPLCKGHDEPCVARSVKKPGPNLGRGFYVCARAKGPASNPEANCNYFQWASSKPNCRETSKK